MAAAETEKVGNPICESCEEDRKNSEKNAAMLPKDECSPLFDTIQQCQKVSGHRVQACFKEWREFAQCKKHIIAKDRGFAYNAPRAPESWLKRHPEFRPYDEVKQQSK